MGMGIPHIRNGFQVIENHLVEAIGEPAARLFENGLDLLQLRFREPGIPEALQGVCNLLRSAHADEHGGHALVPEYPGQRHLRQGLIPFQRQLIQLLYFLHFLRRYLFFLQETR